MSINGKRSKADNPHALQTPAQIVGTALACYVRVPRSCVPTPVMFS